MTTTGTRTTPQTPILIASPEPRVFADSFAVDCRAGAVIGSTGPTGLARRGIDVEGRISIDNGRLRIGMLARPGWGRAGLAYGPFERRPGLTFAALVLNGHNTSQTYEMGDPHRRIARWVLGPPGTDPAWQRLLFWPARLRRESALSQIIRWLDHRPRRTKRPRITDNLAVGWFGAEVPADASAEGHALVMHAADHENGELRTRVAGSPLPISRNIGNIPIHYIVVLRERGAAYYAASLPRANAMAPHPRMRPLAIDPSAAGSVLFAGIHQSVLGEIGFSIDTRVLGVRIAEAPALARWYGSAHAADTLCGSGPLEEAEADIGGRWIAAAGRFVRSPRGASAGDGPAGASAVLEGPGPAGLVHVLVDPGEQPGRAAGLIWRYRDERNFWRVTVGSTGAEIGIMESGAWTPVAASDRTLPPRPAGQPRPSAAVQVIDDGRTIVASLDGAPLFEAVHDERLADASSAGICSTGPGPACRDFEAHPRSVPIPAEADLGPTWCRLGDRVVVTDDFRGPAGDLAGRSIPTSGGGQARWERSIGRGVMEIAGGEPPFARVRASVSAPNPARTAYTIPWDDPEFADVQVDMTPPGTRRGESEEGRSGLIFWQDPRNYIIVNLWLTDIFGGATFSSFFRLRGHENIYDAVWTNIGGRATWGKTFQFRMTFDGLNYVTLADGEPVMYRSLRDVYPRTRRLKINRVGLCANWEFGNDTGTRFGNFVARRGDDPGPGA